MIMPEGNPQKIQEKVICFCNTTKVWGGGEKWHYDMAVLLRQQGYRILTITRKGSALQKKFLQAGLDNVALNISNFSLLNPLMKQKLVKLFLKHKVTTLFMNLPSDLKTAGPAAKRASVKQIIYRRGSAIPVKNTPLNKHLYRNVVDLVLVNSEATKRTILENNPSLVEPDKIKVVYNGIDLEAFDKQQVQPEGYPAKAGLVIGNIGRLVHQKGQKQLVEVARILRDKGVDFHLMIGGEGTEKADLEKLISKNELEEKVTLTGFVDDAKSFLKAVDVFALSSHWEGFGYVLAEAMSCSKPVVAFDVSSNPELVSDGETGFLIPYGDVAAFAEKLAELARDPQLAKEMGAKGREKVEKQFRLKHTLQEVVALLK